MFSLGFIFSFLPLEDGTFITFTKNFNFCCFFLQDESIGIIVRFGS